MSDTSAEVTVLSIWQNLRDLIIAKRLADYAADSPASIPPPFIDDWKRITFQPIDGTIELSLDAKHHNRFRVLDGGDNEFHDSGSSDAGESSIKYLIRATSGYTAAVKAVKRFTFAANISAGDVFVVGNLTGTADTEFAVGGNAAASITNMVAYFTANTSWDLTSDATTITFTAKTAGVAGNSLTLTENAAQVSKSTVTSGADEIGMITLIGLFES